MTGAGPRCDACLLDLDGTVYHRGRAIEGAARAIAALPGWLGV